MTYTIKTNGQTPYIFIVYKDDVAIDRATSQYRANNLINTYTMFDSIPSNIKSNVFVAFKWAKNRLMRLEGEGHKIVLSRNKSTNKICCSFAKPEWPGDHCGKEMETGALAIVISVCEYENGL